MSDPIYFLPRREGKSTLIRAWREAMSTGRTSGAEASPEYVVFVHPDVAWDLRYGTISRMRSVRSSLLKFGPLARSASTRKRARALKWRCNPRRSL